ncbi:hypothetical protein GEMRC1_003297 [Eukaryota sp. GEM-RC1]
MQHFPLPMSKSEFYNGLHFRVVLEDVRVSDIPILDPSSGLPDPYVVFNFDHTQVKTDVIKQTCNPVYSNFREETNVECPSHELLPSRQLSIEVWDKKTFAKDKMVCYGVIDYKSLALGPRSNILNLVLADNQSMMAGTISFSIRFEEIETARFNFKKVNLKVGEITGSERRYNLWVKIILQHKHADRHAPTIGSRLKGCFTMGSSVKTVTQRNTAVGKWDEILRPLRFRECTLAHYIDHELIIKVMHRTFTGVSRHIGTAKVDLAKNFPRSTSNTISFSTQINSTSSGNKLGSLSCTAETFDFPVYGQLTDGVRNINGTFGTLLHSSIEKPYNFKGKMKK